MGCVGSERFLHGLVQGSLGATGRSSGAEIEALKTTPVGWCAKKVGSDRNVLVRNVDALPRWHCRDGRRVGYTVDGVESRRRQVCRAVSLRPVTGSKGWGHVSSVLGTLFGPRSCRLTRYCCSVGAGAASRGACVASGDRGLVFIVFVTVIL